MATKCGQKITADDDDVLSDHKSIEVNCGNLCYIIWSGVPLIQAKDDNDLHLG